MKWRQSALIAGIFLAASPSLWAADLLIEDFTGGDLGQMSAVNLASDANWSWGVYPNGSTKAIDQYVEMNGYGADAPSQDWLLTPVMDLSAISAAVNMKFTTIRSYEGGTFKVYASSNYAGDPQTATWNLITDSDTDKTNFALPGAYFELKESDYFDLSSYAGGQLVVGFEYTSSGTGSGEGAIWRLVDLNIVSDAIPLETSIISTALPNQALTATELKLSASAKGGSAPYTISWDFGDGSSASGEQVTHQYSIAGDYTVTVTTTDADLSTTTASYAINVAEQQSVPIPAQLGELRIAAFNAYLNRNSEGALKAELLDTANPNEQVLAVAEIIQRVRPDVILLNEFDTVMDGTAIETFINQYLKVSQNGAEAIDYPYYYVNESNTGIDSGLDLNGDGQTTGNNNDAFGFGAFPGQYGMALLSRYPIETGQIRTFQKFLWKDMPNALLPQKNGAPYYSPEALSVFRLSSKSHWDIPVNVNGTLVHVLGSHPTPPVFDDGTLDVDSNVFDWNGTRNHDEIRLWADYVDSSKGAYLYDDDGTTGALGDEQRFVILGDQNASPDEGDATRGAINQLLDSALIQGDFIPESQGGIDNDPANSLAKTHTASWKMRADYVLPSAYGLKIEQGAVFWPGTQDVLHRLTDLGKVVSSDHRLVWLDLALTDLPETPETPETTDPSPTPSDTDSPAVESTDDDNGIGAQGFGWFALLTGLLALRRRR